MKNAIVVKDICKNYTDFSLDCVSFTVPQGSIVGFVGENGAGKSTTIRAILDLLTVDSGSVEVLGLSEEERRDPTWKEQIGAVFDVGHVPELLTPVQVGRMMKALYHQWDQQTYEGYLKKWKLPRNKQYKDFSRGMKMKVSLAVAMSHGAKLLVLDEPTGGLDPVVRDDLLDIFLEFIQEEDHSILISSHIISDLEKVADYIVFIHDGKICFQEEKDQLLENCGIVHGTPEQVAVLPHDLVLGRRDNRFACDVLVKDRHRIQRENPNLVIDPVTIEDIMLYTIKGVKR